MDRLYSTVHGTLADMSNEASMAEAVHWEFRAAIRRAVSQVAEPNRKRVMDDSYIGAKQLMRECLLRMDDAVFLRQRSDLLVTLVRVSGNSLLKQLLVVLTKQYLLRHRRVSLRWAVKYKRKQHNRLLKLRGEPPLPKVDKRMRDFHQDQQRRYEREDELFREELFSKFRRREKPT